MTTPTEIKNLSRAQLRRRVDILEAALHIFDRDGYDAARIADIAAAADVAKGTVYLYFENKEALLFAVVSHIVDPFLRDAFSLAQTHDRPAKELLKQQLRMMMSRVTDGDMKTILKLIISLGGKQKKLSQFYFDNVYAPSMKALEQLLSYGVHTGEFRADAALMAPHVLAGPAFLVGVRDIIFKDLDKTTSQKIVEDHIQVIISGLEKVSPQ